MIRVCAVWSLRVKFNVDLSFSEIRRIYSIKFKKHKLRQRKHKGRVRKNSLKEL